MTFSDAIGRHWRRLRNLLQTRPVELVYGSGYLLELPGTLHDSQRGERILTFLSAEKLLRGGAVHTPRPVPLKLLEQVHDEDYLDSLHANEALTRAIGYRVTDLQHDRILDLQRLMAGGSRLAARLALSSGGTAINLGGGFHHAFPDRGERFCIFNDIAAAIVAERLRGFDEPVLVVDLDLHDGDGTRAIFADDETVHTFSVHNLSSKNGDAVASTSIELPDGTGDEEYLAVLHERLPPVFEAVEPGLVIYLAGSDPAEDDALGNWRITAEGMLERDRLVAGLAGAGEPLNGAGDDESAAAPPEPRPTSLKRVLPGLTGHTPLVVLLAGGYGKQSWRYSARFIAWLISGDVLEPPTLDEITVERYRRLARRFQPSELTAEEPGNDFGLTEEDVLGALGGAARRTRFLGYYSRHGVELALERTGALDRIRTLGFDSPDIELDLNNPAGETVRIFGDLAHHELLMELRVRPDGSTLPGFEMLRVEWLLLQNPRREFDDTRPRLPGQRHPGLGFLRETVALLILVCDRLGLDGLLFVPSHFHLATPSRKFLRFVEPEAEGRFRALRRVLEPLGMPEASRAVEEGRVIDADGETVGWQPSPMVLAVSDRLEEHIQSEGFEARAKACEERCRFHLRPADG